MRESEKREGGSGKEVGELGRRAAEFSEASSGCRGWVGGEGRREGGGGRVRRALKGRGGGLWSCLW